MLADIAAAARVLAQDDGAPGDHVSLDIAGPVAAVGLYGESENGVGLLVALFHRSEPNSPWQLTASSWRETRTIGGLIAEAADCGPEPVRVGAITDGPYEVEVYASSSPGQYVTVGGRDLLVSPLGFVVTCRETMA